MKQIIITCTLLLCSVLWAFSQTTIVNYDFNSGTSYSTLSPNLASNINCSVNGTEAFTTYNGTVSGSSAFTSNSTAGNAIAMSNSSGTNTKYWTFSISGSVLNSYKSYKLYLQAQRSSAGATTITIATSTNGSTFTNFSTTMSTGNGSFTEQVFDLTGITTLDNQNTVYIRILASGASGAGTLRIDNFEVQASYNTISKTTWDLTGNSGTNEATDFIGTTDNTGLNIKTNNLTRVNIENNGKVNLNNNLAVTGKIETDSIVVQNYLRADSIRVRSIHVGDSSLWICGNPNGTTTTPNNILSSNGLISFGRYSSGAPWTYNYSAITLGVGTQAPNNDTKLHLHSQMFALQTTPTLMQFTNGNTGSTVNDGLRLGVLTNGTAVLNQQEDGKTIQFNLRQGNNVMTNSRRMEIFGQTITVDGENASNITRVAISENGANPITIPRTLLHLGQNTPLNGGGWRDWMDIGTYTSGGVAGLEDNMYVGLKFFNNSGTIEDTTGGDPPPTKAVWTDRSDAVIEWGDNGQSSITPPDGPDNLRFIFSSTNTGAQTGANSYEGLEIARMTPWGNMGIGPLFTNNNVPKRRLEIHDDGGTTIDGLPQLRLSQTTDPIINLGIYTDFQTTSPSNSYAPNSSNTGGHLLINPRNSKFGEMRTVGINFVNANTPIFAGLSLDVNGQMNIRTVNPDLTDTLNQILVWNPSNEGRVMWRDLNSIIGNGADGDWYDVATNQPPLLADIDHDKYTFGKVYINIPTTGTGSIPAFDFVRFGVIQDLGTNSTGNYMSVAGGFKNTYPHIAQNSSE
jgi:hypothetical protein